MSQPQPGIVPEPSANALFLILRVRDAHADGAAVGVVLARIPGLTAAVGKLDKRAALACTVSIGPEFWDVLAPAKRPAGLRQFRAINAGGLNAPSTGGDVLLHLLCKRPDLNFELAQRVRGELGASVEVMDEVHGFRYLDGRDLTGFIDGTENPKGKARGGVALIGREDPNFAGGSFVFAQRYVHNLDKWATVPVDEQERIIGRRKRDSKELSDKQKPATAHIARTVIEEGDEELEIVRHSFPYGNVNQMGLFFIAYCRTLDIPERMLRRMMGTSGDGLHDRLMEFSQAVSGAHFFAPSLKVLKGVAS